MDQLMSIRVLFNEICKEAALEASQETKKDGKPAVSDREMRALKKCLTNLSKNIFTKARRRMVPATPAQETAPLDTQLQEQAEALQASLVEKLAQLNKLRDEVPAFLDQVIAAEFKARNDGADAQAAADVSSGELQAAAARKPLPSDAEFARLQRVREDIVAELDRLQALQPTVIEATKGVASFLEKKAKPETALEKILKQPGTGDIKPTSSAGKAASSAPSAKAKARADAQPY